MFWHSRFSFRNLKDANSCMFSWCITTSSLLICSWHYVTLSQFVQEMYSIYSKSLLFTSISYVQESFKLKKWIMDKSVFLYWWFSFDLKYYLILGSTNNVLHSSVKENLCTLWSLALAKNSCNNINNSHAQVSKLCHFLWLWINQI